MRGSTVRFRSLAPVNKIRDIAKHRMSWEVTPIVSGVTVRGEAIMDSVDLLFRTTKEFLELATWDIPIIDILIFYGRNIIDPRPLYSALKLFNKGMESSEDDYGIILGPLNELSKMLHEDCESRVLDYLKEQLGGRLTPTLKNNQPLWFGTGVTYF